MTSEASLNALAPPVFDGINYQVWVVRMEAYLDVVICGKLFRLKLTAKKVMEITYEEKHSLEMYPLNGFSSNSLSLMQLAMARASHIAFAIQENPTFKPPPQRLARDKLVHLNGWRSLALSSVGPGDLKAF
ncbi:hypothetical protein CK203_096089 [Vitis vinifera]|uniref:DUF4219 domain-containing protein n=1 Tax=Vitis vinifera TaxID=29760 RepID=A0A438CN54_VITVI|nr:hypothetical protein CK203_096089 [Vitis vinifera]